MNDQVIKVFDGYPCAHRQWRHDRHCKHIHGYQRRFVCHFHTGTTDVRGWVIDFGGPAFKEAKRVLAAKFDHTLLLASDDPHIEYFRQHDGDVCKLVELPYGPGMEGSARYVLELLNKLIEGEEPETHARGTRCFRVECWENEKNCGVYDVREGA